MRNQDCLDIFEKYLREEKKASANTLSSYMRDIRQLASYLEEYTDVDILTATDEDLNAYISYLKESGKSVATVSRSIASIKNQWELNYLEIKGYLFGKLLFCMDSVYLPVSHIIG